MTETHVLKMDLGVTVTGTFDGDIPLFSCEWDPPPPWPKKLSKRILSQYRPWRDKIFKDYADRTGKKILLVEC